MTIRTLAVVIAGLSLVTGAVAAVTAERPPAEGEPTVERANAPVPMRWVPSWLMEPLSRAIADATDTRDRKTK